MHPPRSTQSRVTTTTLSKLCRNYLILTLVSTLVVSANKTDTKMTDFVGTYKFEKDDGHFDDFLKALNVGFFIRKIAATTSPTIDISVKDDGTYILKTTSTFKTSQIEFKLGEEFDEKRMDGATVKTTITRDGNKLIHKQNDNNLPVEIVREFTGDKLITTCKCKDVINVREYRKV